jgi:hypothetical protein
VTPTRLWFALIALGGLGFGLAAERRPFGDGFLSHPLVVFFLVTTAALLALRVLLARPVPDIIPERALLLGCLGGLAMFLVGNGLGVHVFAAH